MKVRKPLSVAQRFFGVMLHDAVLFDRYFLANELTLPMSTRQKLLLNDQSEKVLAATGRKAIKTISIEGDVLRYGIFNPGRKEVEMMLVTPGDSQLRLLQDRILPRTDHNVLFKVLKRSFNKNDGLLSFHTGVRWYMKIDGTSGNDHNMVGFRLTRIIGDEMQMTVRVCHNSRAQSALPGCKWKYCGVANGVRTTVFYELDKTSLGSGWSRHKVPTYANPLYWHKRERAKLRRQYPVGQDYTNLVWGEWGEEIYSSFPVEYILSKSKKEQPYSISVLEGKDLGNEITNSMRVKLISMMKIPEVRSETIILGMDYGSLQDPTEIGLAYLTRVSPLESTSRKREDEEEEKPKNMMDWQMFARIEVNGATPIQQAKLIHLIVSHLGFDRVKCLSIDLDGSGRGILDYMLSEMEDRDFWQYRVHNFAANSSVDVQDLTDPRRTKKVRRKQFATELLQAGMMAARTGVPEPIRLTLGDDPESIQELIDTSQRQTASGAIEYLPPILGGNYKRPIDHRTDMYRNMMMAAYWVYHHPEEQERGESDETMGFSQGNPFITKQRAGF